MGRAAGEGRRHALAADANLTATEVAALSDTLAGFDRRSPAGPWTHDVLLLIRDHPRTLADRLRGDLELLAFKRRVRRLKELGLTRSLEVGYELSPRGAECLRREGRSVRVRIGSVEQAARRSLDDRRRVTVDAAVPAPRLLYLVKQLELAIRARLDVALRKHGITVPQYTALTVLERHPEMTSAQLARHAFVSAQAMDGVVRALQASGYIERHRNADNRRQIVISLTSRALSMLEECREAVDQIEDIAFGELSPQERAQLSQWLAHGRRALEASPRPLVAD